MKSDDIQRENNEALDRMLPTHDEAKRITVRKVLEDGKSHPLTWISSVTRMRPIDVRAVLDLMIADNMVERIEEYHHVASHQYIRYRLT